MMEPRIELPELPSTKLYFTVGETILREGDLSDGWFVLLSGKVGVFKRDFSVAEISKAGSVIGEIGYLLNSPRTATLIAQEPTLLQHFTIGVDELFRKYPDIARRMAVTLAFRLAKTTEDWRESVGYRKTT